MDKVTTLGTGGRLYRDSRPAEADPETDQPDQTEQVPKKPRNRLRAKIKPDRTPPAWTLREMAPEQPVSVPKDWRQICSTIAELLGIALISGGVAMHCVWLGIVVLGVAILVMGIAVGMPQITIGQGPPK